MRVQAKVKLYHGVVRQAGEEFNLAAPSEFDPRVHLEVSARGASKTPAPEQAKPETAATERTPVQSPDQPEPEGEDDARSAPQRVQRRRKAASK